MVAPSQFGPDRRVTVTIARTYLYQGMMVAVIGATAVGTAEPLEAQDASTIVVSARVVSPGPSLPELWRALLRELPDLGRLQKTAPIREARRIAETPLLRIDAAAVLTSRGPHRGPKTASAAPSPKPCVRLTVSFIAN